MTLKEFESKIRQLLDLPGNADRVVFVGMHYADGVIDMIAELDGIGTTPGSDGKPYDRASTPILFYGVHDE